MGMKRVMIADDAEFMRQMLKEILKGLNYEVVAEAVDGQDAVEKYAAVKPDFVTMDMVMPRLSGLDAIRKIRETDPKARILVVSAIDQPAVLKEAVQAGAVDFIVKPFRPDRIAATLTKLVA